MQEGCKEAAGQRRLSYVMSYVGRAFLVNRVEIQYNKQIERW